jgi:hypothetical protein
MGLQLYDRLQVFGDLPPDYDPYGQNIKRILIILVTFNLC